MASQDNIQENSDAAASLIREKVARIYAEEPEAGRELAEAKTEDPSERSKHQQFMYNLGRSGKDLATIQTEWHNYYQGLSDQEKHQVWQEFYDSQPSLSTIRPTGSYKPPVADSAQLLSAHKQQAAKPIASRKVTKPRSTKEIKAAIRSKVTADGQLKAKHHLQSLIFGLGMGFLVVFIFMIGFFNEILIAPFIQPSRTVTATPIILSSNNVAPASTSTPEVIIPKINVEIPVDYNETSTNESVIEDDLEDGVVHYPTTVLPGQDGNAAFFGHSSNNIFNQGKYKFAFVLLHTLSDGDTFYLTYNNTVYVYKVISHTIVSPNDVSVLGPVPGQTATATLITCDPPGTSINRLIVVGQQISPDPSGNTAATPMATTSSAPPTVLPGNGPTLWDRFFRTIVGKLITLAVVAGGLWFALRQTHLSIGRDSFRRR
jgi:LPXTG-site transpeptidase (sortase) family protein